MSLVEDLKNPMKRTNLFKQTLIDYLEEFNQNVKRIQAHCFINEYSVILEYYCKTNNFEEVALEKAKEIFEKYINKLKNYLTILIEELNEDIEYGLRDHVQSLVEVGKRFIIFDINLKDISESYLTDGQGYIIVSGSAKGEK
jgi:hypothetical protein